MNPLIAVLWLAFSISCYMVVHAATNMCRGSCEVDFLTIGCYKEKDGTRALPHYIYNERDPSIKNYGGRNVDWFNWNEYFPGFACRCAEKAVEKGYDLIGLQFYGECWSSQSGHLTYDVNGPSTSKCIDQCAEPCKLHSKFCSGKKSANYVYKIVDGSCEVDITPVGCFKEDPSRLAMEDIFYNEADPGKPNYGGNMLQLSSNYNADFSEFLCQCARVARMNQWDFFGVRELGLCVRSTPTLTNYNEYGSSDQCFEGKSSAPCPSGSKLCGGLDDNANYVYKITV